MTREQWRILGGLAAIVGVYAFFMSGKCPSELKAVPPDSEFDPIELREGTLVEFEHTTNRPAAKTIAKHHLMEDPFYYQKLATIHED